MSEPENPIVTSVQETISLLQRELNSLQIIGRGYLPGEEERVGAIRETLPLLKEILDTFTPASPTRLGRMLLQTSANRLLTCPSC